MNPKKIKKIRNWSKNWFGRCLMTKPFRFTIPKELQTQFPLRTVHREAAEDHC